MDEDQIKDDAVKHLTSIAASDVPDYSTAQVVVEQWIADNRGGVSRADARRISHDVASMFF